MKTYTRPSRGTLRAHHLVKLSLILTVSICVLIGRWQSPINKASETQIGSLSTAAERMAFLRGAALPVGQLKGAQNFRDLKEGGLRLEMRIHFSRKSGMPRGAMQKTITTLSGR